MRYLLFAILSSTFLLSSTASASTSVPRFIPLDKWEVSAGDSVVLDTQNNIIHLVSKDGRYTSDTAGSGQRRMIYYIGRYYNATTPEREWKMKTKHIKGDRWTFGDRGIFLRLFYKGESTPYGIHSMKNIDEKFEKPADERFISAGCGIVNEPMLDRLMAMMELSGDEGVTVITKYGIEQEDLIARMDPEQIEPQIPSWIAFLLSEEDEEE